jgi:hypothetical protein
MWVSGSLARLQGAVVDGCGRGAVRVGARLCAAAALVALAAPAVASADLMPFGHSCSDPSKTLGGVRSCPTDTSNLPSVDNRVPSFDGTPLDVDVTLPTTGNGPFPTIVMLHWLGGDKGTFEQPGADQNLAYHYTNVDYAQRGYAVVNYTARGFGASCGTLDSRTANCGTGFTHIADQRYEARDSQYLLGVLVDEGIAQPGTLGVTGISYGGGQAIELAYLKNRIRLPDGSFAPWTTPKGVPLSISAAYARWPWSDLGAALLPNGRFMDTDVPGEPSGSFNPFGVELQSEFAGVFTNISAWNLPPHVDPSGDLATWYSVFGAGEPYGIDAQQAASEMCCYHQAYGLNGTPAPLLLESGFNDALFPADQALRVYNSLRAASPGAQVALQIGDLGHSTGADKPGEDIVFDDQAAGFFDAWLRGIGTAPSPGSVSAFTQTCWWGIPAVGPYTAPRWSALATGTFRFGSATTPTKEPQNVSSDGGSAKLAADYDPGIGGNPIPNPTPISVQWPTDGRDACHAVSAETDAGTAVYTATSPGLTMMGMPTVTATVNTTGLFGELAARLWDVLPDQTQRLVSRGIYRLADNQQGQITFQLHGNGYLFGAGDTIKLELLGRDAPYYRASNGTFTVAVSNVNVSLPTTGSWYQIASQAGGGCVDAAAATTSDGTAVQQSTCASGTPSQQWQLQPTATGNYLLLNRNASAQDEVWDVTGGSKDDGATVQLSSFHGGMNPYNTTAPMSDPQWQPAHNEQWQAVALGADSESYEFINLNSRKCLDLPGGSTTTGVQLQQATCNGSPEQVFRLQRQT